MRYLFPIALAVIAIPTATAAQNQPDAGIPGSLNAATSAVIVGSYGLTPSSASAREELATLKRLCASKRYADRQRCDAAWTRINAEYARMQAEKAPAS